MIYFTNSKGERLPEDINKVANRYYDGEIMPDENNELWIYYAFDWDKTKERGIWNNVDNNNYQPFYEFHNMPKQVIKAKQTRKAEIIAEIEKLQNELKEL